MERTLAAQNQPDSIGAVPPQPEPLSTESYDSDSTVLYMLPAAEDIVIPRTARKIEDTPVPNAPETSQVSHVPAEKWNFQLDYFNENALEKLLPGKTSYPAAGHVNTVPRPSATFPVRERETGNHDWLLGIFLFITFLFIWIRLFYGRFFSVLLNAFSSLQLAIKLFRERNILQSRVSIVIDFIYLLALSLFLFVLSAHFGWLSGKRESIYVFLAIFNVVVLYAVLRSVVLKITGFVFDNGAVFAEYTHHVYVINKVAGIFLFPVVVLSHYLPDAIVPVLQWTGILLCVGAFIFKIIRSYQIIIRKHIPLFYLFLYLCTLEILPLLLGYKVVISLI